MSNPNNQPATTTKVPQIDVHRQNGPLREQVLAAVASVYDSGHFILGPEVAALETELGAYCEAKHSIACASGSDALLLALLALDIGQGDEVICPSFTFFATAGAIWRTGATPVFVDIDPTTYNLDPKAVEAAVTPLTKAIIPVHLFGRSADMDALTAIATKHKIALIEDACQSIGSTWKGKPVGSIGDIGCYSFYPTKNLGGWGDGGLVTANDDKLADRLRLLRDHGQKPRYHHSAVGINSRLDAVQAAMLRVKLRHLDSWSDARAAHATGYHTAFRATGMDSWLGLPSAGEHRSVWNQYTIRVPNGERDSLRDWLAARGIGAAIYYPIPLHLQDCFKSLGYRQGSLPHTERACNEVLSLPMFAELTVAERNAVVDAVASYRKAGARKAA